MNPRLAYSPILASDAISGSGQASVAHAQRRLLAVDDDRSVRNALWVTFRELYTVTLADSGPQAIQTFREQRVVPNHRWSPIVLDSLKQLAKIVAG